MAFGVGHDIWSGAWHLEWHDLEWHDLEWGREYCIEWVVLADGAVRAGILRWVCASKVKSMLSGRVCDFK